MKKAMEIAFPLQSILRAVAIAGILGGSIWAQAWVLAPELELPYGLLAKVLLGCILWLYGVPKLLGLVFQFIPPEYSLWTEAIVKDDVLFRWPDFQGYRVAPNLDFPAYRNLEFYEKSGRLRILSLPGKDLDDQILSEVSLHLPILEPESLPLPPAVLQFHKLFGVCLYSGMWLWAVFSGYLMSRFFPMIESFFFGSLFFGPGTLVAVILYKQARQIQNSMGQLFSIGLTINLATTVLAMMYAAVLVIHRLYS